MHTRMWHTCSLAALEVRCLARWITSSAKTPMVRLWEREDREIAKDVSLSSRASYRVASSLKRRAYPIWAQVPTGREGVKT